MRIDIHHHHHGLDALLGLIAGLKEQIMAVSAQIAAFSERVNVATTEIAADLKALRDKVAAGGTLSPEDIAVLDGIVTNLDAMGKDPADPVPDTPGV